MFANSDDFHFDVKKEYNDALDNGLKSKAVLEKSIEQHADETAVLLSQHGH